MIPLTADGLICASSMVMLDSARRKARPSKISGKIRRIELRARAADESIAKPRGTTKF